MSAESSAVWGASAPETSAACCATVGPARSTAGWYAALLAAGRSWGGCALGTTPDGFLVTGAQWQDRASAVPSGMTACRPAARSRTRPHQGGTHGLLNPTRRPPAARRRRQDLGPGGRVGVP